MLRRQEYKPGFTELNAYIFLSLAKSSVAAVGNEQVVKVCLQDAMAKSEGRKFESLPGETNHFQN